MNVSSTSNSNDIWKILEASKTSSAAASSSVTGIGSDGSSLSMAAKLFSTLDTLSQSNPSEFKKMTAEIATKLQDAAKASSDPAQASALNELAANFQSASKSGKFNDLFSQGAADTTAKSSAGGLHHYRVTNDLGPTNTSASGLQSVEQISAILSSSLK